MSAVGTGGVGAVGADRVPLGIWPTPLHPAPRLSAELGVEVWFKRDDLCGFGLGGNKVRGLEFLLADAERRGCDVVVTGGGPQSNWTMLAALAARVRGLDAVLVNFGDPVAPEGNLALAVQAGATVRFTGDPDRAAVDAAVEAVAAELRAAGRRPYPLGRGGATGVGALGYVAATAELALQLGLGDAADARPEAAGRLRPAQLWVATGSCGTQAGLHAGAAWLRPGYEVVGVAVSRPVDESAARVARIAAEACDLLGVPHPAAPPTVVDGRGAAKGVRSPEGDAAADLVARTEGVFLDPVFGAKAMAGLVAAVRAGRVPGPVVYAVTGGAPTLFTV